MSDAARRLRTLALIAVVLLVSRFATAADDWPGYICPMTGGGAWGINDFLSWL